MLELFEKHSYIAICLAVLLEELGIPMPIPTDLLIVFAGVRGGRSLGRLAIWFGLLNIASAIGASGLYAIVRRGGRPLIERFGRYIHLGPEQIARAERLMSRGGWWSIAIGRAIPGLRYLAVIACGLLRIPYLHFLTAHVVGSSVYITVFLALGALIGPTVIEYLHLPEIQLRLIWLLALAVGLPLLLAWLCYRGHAEYKAAPSRRRTLGAILLASFAGAISMAAAWAAAATFAAILGEPRPLNAAIFMADRLLGHGLRPTAAYVLAYSGVLLLSVSVGAMFYELVLPALAPRGTALLGQALGLTLMGFLLVSAFLSLSLLVSRGGPLDRWWAAGGPLLGAALLIGALCYAFTTACARALAIAILPSSRRAEPRPQATPAESSPASIGPAPGDPVGTDHFQG